MRGVMFAFATFALLEGCATAHRLREGDGIQFAAVEARSRPSPPQNKRRSTPKPQQPQVPQQASPKGSGDVMPVADIGVGSSSKNAAMARVIVTAPPVGSPIGGLPGAVWADGDNDGYVDGYVYNGEYYQGAPGGYDPETRSVLAGAAAGAFGGAALGSAAGAVVPGVSILQGAVVGAAVPGLAGAVWADRNYDGVVDGYVYNGQYYAGAPSLVSPPSVTPKPGAERG